MRKGRDWNSVQAYDGESTALKPGAYICVVKGMKETRSRNGAPMIELMFDIAEGEYKDYYLEKYRREKLEHNKVSYKGIYRTLLETKDGNTNPYFKGLITVIEKSNGFVLPDEFSENDVKGKLFGGLFRKREWEKDKWVTELTSVRTVEAIREGNYILPEDKPLNNNSNGNSQYQGFSIDNDADDEDLLF